jgi:hypothetical protein
MWSKVTINGLTWKMMNCWPQLTTSASIIIHVCVIGWQIAKHICIHIPPVIVCFSTRKNGNKYGNRVP